VQPITFSSPQTRITASNCRTSPQTEAKVDKSFFGSFFQKKNAFLPCLSKA
jgi:hypothetical protein